MTDHTENLLQRMYSVTRQQRVDYEDALFRWLAAKRDYPWNNEPEPNPGFFLVFLYRDKIIREFQRTT